MTHRFLEKTLLMLIMAVSGMACNDSDDDSPSRAAEEENTHPFPSVSAFSLSQHNDGMDIFYKIYNAESAHAQYKAHTSEEWKEAESTMNDSVLTVVLRNLQNGSFYYVKVDVKNTDGLSASETITARYDYDPTKTTYYQQPFLLWDYPLSNITNLITDSQNIESISDSKDGGTELRIRFCYMELYTTYRFHKSDALNNIIVTFDENRVTKEELMKYLIGALGYLTYGNIHLNINGNVQTVPVYKTAEGRSVVFVYHNEDKGTVEVEYLPSKGFDYNETIYR